MLCVRPEDDPKLLKAVPMGWFGHMHLLEREVLPLALLEPPCLFRAAALQRLEASGRRFRVLVETASLSGIRAAVQAGLAITCRGPLFGETAPLLTTDALPALARAGYAIYDSPMLSPAATRLEALLRQAVLALS